MPSFTLNLNVKNAQNPAQKLLKRPVKLQTPIDFVALLNVGFIARKNLLILCNNVMES